jgi:transposase InsO family protein
MAKSSFFYHEKALQKLDKYIEIRKIIEQIFIDSRKTYGYRRIHAILKNKQIQLSEKVVRRIMREDLLSVQHVKKRKYSSYKGEISPAVPNIVNRNFHADKPNKKWLTDITMFHISTGKIYLSPIIDCFDGMVVTWSIGTSPSANLVNGMLDEALTTLKNREYPIVHSDRGCHYRWPGWIARMNNAKLVRSMSEKGCSPDNAACEGFFGRLKNEMFYGKSWLNVTKEEFIKELNIYIKWYNEKRIKMSLGAMSPLEYRYSLGLLG